MQGVVPVSHPEWKKRRASGDKGFIVPIGAAEAADQFVDDEESMEKTWTNLTFEEVKAVMKQELINRERTDQPHNAPTDEVIDGQSGHWEEFYRRNKEKFFKDRNYMSRDYPELQDVPEVACVMEGGCGAGNSIWPLAKAHPNWTFQAFDCAATAVDLVNGENNDRVKAYVWDPSLKPPAPCPFAQPESIDLTLLVFFLSALGTEEALRHVAQECYRWTSVGGRVILRDYGVYDMTQLRFAGKKSRKIGKRLYRRADGTLTRFFKLEEVENVFKEAGFKSLRCVYECRELRNRKTMIKMYRVWVSCVFQK